eukprot:CAMPEP_0198143864 /NCGR_PEP_ID=MMETSP1443-20131203/11075_1 /TAXON_ID=186043 /ORGANISM="Entomoneis sp., Strain CCMP2396" /LENGTH=394 /DNA_ID=CAMNT_0043807161 /DNA_START=65 /DNA_END=1249 /DNA_ORIENTATION=-
MVGSAATAVTVERMIRRTSLLAFVVTGIGIVTVVNAQTQTPSVSPTSRPTANVEGTCGDCWCIPDDDGRGVGIGECPAFYPGLIQKPPEQYAEFYETFSNSGSLRPFEDVQGNSDCFPFRDSLGVINGFPQSQWQQCNKYESFPSTTVGGGTSNVCAFVYDDLTEPCRGRSYEAVTFASKADAQAATDGGNKLVSIMHAGACGVCSNAVDYAARLSSVVNKIDPLMILCGTDYAAKPNKNSAFPELIQCIQNAIKFTTPCATLWAFFTATNAYECPLDCVTNAFGNVVYNLDPPQCLLSECLVCSSDGFESDFNAIAGLWKSMYNAGVVDAIAYPCSSFYRVDSHDPCQGTPVTPQPTPGPSNMAPGSTSEGTRGSDFVFFWIAFLALCSFSLL